MAGGKFVIDAVFKATDKMSAVIGRMDKKVQGFIKSTEQGLGKVSKFNDRIAGGLQKAGAITAGVTVATAAIVQDIVKVGAEFDKTLVGAAAKFDPTLKRGTAGFERLRMAAEDVGAKTEFNAQQGAEALKGLASAGLDAEQAIAALPGVVDLATASEIDLGTASEMATKSLGAFGLKVEDATQLGLNLARVTDVMATTSGKTEASMEGLFESIKEGAPVAVAAGQSMETFMAMAGKLAGAGIEGSTAGTTLKNVMLSLSAPTTKAAKQLKKLGITTKDSKGNLRDVVDIFGDLEKATKGMGTAQRAGALEAIFGKIPIAGVSALLDQGADKIAALRMELENAAGSTKTMADTMRDTVAGDIDGFTSAIDGVKIALFSTNTGPIRDVIQNMTKWVAANKELIVQNVGNTVKWISDNMATIVTWLERIAKGVAAFWAFKTAVDAMKLAVEGYEAAVALAKGAQWAFNASLGGTRVAAVKAGTALAGMRTALNATAMVQSINGLTGLMAGGLVVAAGAVGYLIGSWLNDTFKLDEKLSGMIAKWTGLDDTIEKHGGRTDKQGLQPGGDQYLADGSIKRADGTWVYKSPARLAKEAQQQTAGGPQVVSPQERVARSITETKETTTAELLIKDETGKAMMTKKPKAPGVKLRLQPSGAF